MTIDLTGLVRPHLVEMTKREDNPNIAEFRLQPLERGFGYTLGNSLRRMLLSSLRGTAVWGFRLDGVVHEHQTVQGVLEDVHQIVQRLKALTLVLDPDIDEAVLRIRREGKGPVYARDIQENANVTVRESRPPAVHAAGRSGHQLRALRQQGRGYVESELHPLDRSLPVDLVRIDAIYNPVRRANFTVSRDPSRSAHRLRPARRHGGDQRHHHPRGRDRLCGRSGPGALPLLRGVRQGPDRAPECHARDRHRSAGGLALTLGRLIDDLGLSVRTLNSLKNSNIRTLKDLVEYSEEELLDVKNVGEKAVAEIGDLLRQEGLDSG